jgi:hypothetical protein
MPFTDANESGRGSNFATSRTAASLASMPASCIIMMHQAPHALPSTTRHDLILARPLADSNPSLTLAVPPASPPHKTVPTRTHAKECYSSGSKLTNRELRQAIGRGGNEVGMWSKPRRGRAKAAELEQRVIE